MSRIWFAGDVHGRFSHVLWALEQAKSRPQAIIFLGDLEPSRPLRQEYAPFQVAEIKCWHIHGNHDTDRLDTWRNLEDGAEHSLDGRVVEIAGLRIAGLGGIFRGEVWYPQQGSEAPVYRSYDEYAREIRRQAGLKARLSPQDLARLQDTPRPDPDLLEASRHGKLLKHHSTIFPDTVDRLAKLEADILVTHEAPAGHPYGFGALDELARAMRVRVLIHGHHHVEHRYAADEKGTFVTIPVGYCGIRDETGKVILEAKR